MKVLSGTFIFWGLLLKEFHVRFLKNITKLVPKSGNFNFYHRIPELCQYN
jgi:hypothetical protein